MDFIKQVRENKKRKTEIFKRSDDLIASALKILKESRKDLDSHMQLVKASEPLEILKKGFTLTLDEDQKIIKSVKEFNRKGRATLKFFDGRSGIKKENK